MSKILKKTHQDIFKLVQETIFVYKILFS